MEQLTWKGPWTKSKIAQVAGLLSLSIALVVMQSFGLMGSGVDWMVLPVFLYFSLTSSKPIICALKPSRFKGSPLALFGFQVAGLALFVMLCALCKVLPATTFFGVVAVAVWYLCIKKAYNANMANEQSLSSQA